MTECVIRHCAPTLAGIKAGSLVSGEAGSARAWLEEMRLLLKRFGLDGIVLCECGPRSLLYIYRPAMLACVLADERVRKFLSTHGYTDFDVSSCVAHLRNRFLGQSEFPHEVGIYLSYPLGDVEGFIEHKGAQYKRCGHWKVYTDVDHAEHLFSAYNDCTRSLLGRYRHGARLERLLAV